MPTRSPAATGVATQDLAVTGAVTQAPMDMPVSTASPTTHPPPPPTGTPALGLYTLQQRVSVCGASASPEDAAARFRFGWYLEWLTTPYRFCSATVEYMPMIRLKEWRSYGALGGINLVSFVKDRSYEDV
jgi:hypothetical protein